MKIFSMEYMPFNLEIVTGAGAFALFTWLVLRPLIKWFIARQNGTSVDVEDRLHHIENDQYHYILKELEGLKRGQEYLRKEAGEMRIDIAVLKTKVNRQ